MNDAWTRYRRERFWTEVLGATIAIPMYLACAVMLYVIGLGTVAGALVTLVQWLLST